MNEGFRDCVRIIYRKLGVEENLEPGYLAALEELHETCADWHRERGPKMGHLVLLVPDLANCEALLSGGLDAAESFGFCGNAAAVDFVRWIDCRTKHKCTLLMFQVVVYLQTAIKEFRTTLPTMNASGGSA